MTFALTVFALLIVIGLIVYGSSLVLKRVAPADNLRIPADLLTMLRGSRAGNSALYNIGILNDDRMQIALPILRRINELTAAGFYDLDEPVKSRLLILDQLKAEQKEETKQKALSDNTDIINAELLGIKYEAPAKKNDPGKPFLDSVKNEEIAAKKAALELKEKRATKFTATFFGEAITKAIYDPASDQYFIYTVDKLGNATVRRINRSMYNDIIATEEYA